MESAKTPISSTTPTKTLEDVEKWSSSDEVRIEAASYIVDSEAEKRLVRRIDIRLVPASMIIYLLCFLDRSNIGNAKLLNSATGDSLVQVTHMSNQQYLVALMIFIVSYTVFETPSNYMLKKFRPSRWLAFLMFGWGTMTMILGAVNNFGGVVAVRFLLGAFEAGLFPGMVYCLTFWYKPEERALRVALILACATLGGAFGGAIAFAVGHMNGAHGLQAWRWLFIIEGAPSCAAAILTYFTFPNFPETETWLSPEERELAIERIKGVASLGHHKIVWKEAKDTLTDWRLYLHYLVTERSALHCTAICHCICGDRDSVLVLRPTRNAFLGDLCLACHCWCQLPGARCTISYVLQGTIRPTLRGCVFLIRKHPATFELAYC
ncbi:unnamed protein product [Somion occarium]|uniref:Major facilitator superfamily (MFS) profile domain-containing protein n=1 Tax=Somion occarium TaxID=3059160 RepID=A0ABP1D6E4_9APHY